MYRWWTRGDAMRPPALLQSSANILGGDMVIMVRGGGTILETLHFYTIYFILSNNWLSLSASVYRLLES